MLTDYARYSAHGGTCNVYLLCWLQGTYNVIDYDDSRAPGGTGQSSTVPSRS